MGDNKNFACRCGCGFDQPHPKVVEIIEAIEEAFERVWVTSGCRCWKHNRDVGGAKNSFHLNGMAADFLVKGTTPAEVADFIYERWGGEVGLIEYHTFVHVDVRVNPPYLLHIPSRKGAT